MPQRLSLLSLNSRPLTSHPMGLNQPLEVKAPGPLTLTLGPLTSLVKEV